MKVALIRAGAVENVIVSTLAFAQTLGYDLALDLTGATRIAGAWVIGGTTYPDAALPAETANAITMDSQADQALANLRAYRDLASPTQAQTVAFCQLAAKVLIFLVRFHLNKLDGAN